jgi:2-polyprenyl-3-methyl-5-hydroxy-6-metoxy-1,4-benzoquinol methylase
MNHRQLHEYSALFYQYQREGSLRSACRVLPLLTSEVAVRSVLDVGCGAGALPPAVRSMRVCGDAPILDVSPAPVPAAQGCASAVSGVDRYRARALGASAKRAGAGAPLSLWSSNPWQ